MPYKETIIALSTPVGESAIAVIRISGPSCCDLYKSILRRKCIPKVKEIAIGNYCDQNHCVVDNSLFILFPDGKSYTGEQMLEVHCHGNQLIIQKIIRDMVDRGCRIAEPGEFTRTSFENGKISLSQAEAVINLIKAKSDFALSVAQDQLSGSFDRKIISIKDKILNIISSIESDIDFSSSNLIEIDIESQLVIYRNLIKEVKSLIDVQKYKSLLLDNVQFVILGSPNVGKSSLFNFLVSKRRAIVSSLPGTTRDFISENVSINPYNINLVDTAGLRISSDFIESEGLNKTLQKAQESNFYIIVIDNLRNLPMLHGSIIKKLTNKNTLLILNKIDLNCSIRHIDFLHKIKRLHISVKTGEGLSDFSVELKGLIEKSAISPKDQRFIINESHIASMRKVVYQLKFACRMILAKQFKEVISRHLSIAIKSLNKISQNISSDCTLDRLFNQFCVGK